MKRLFIILFVLFLAFCPTIHAETIKDNFSDIVTTGPWLDSRAYASLAEADAAAVAGDKPLWIAQDYTLAADTTLSSHVYVVKGNLITTTGHTLTIANLNAGKYAIFNGSGSVNGLKEAYPEWWGGAVDNASDNTIAINNCLASLSGGGICRLSTGTYRFANIYATVANTTLQGVGWSSVLSTTMSGTAKTNPAVWLKANGTALKDLKVTWVTRPATLAANNPINDNNTISVGWSEITGAQTLIEDVLIENIYVLDGKQHGIGIGRSHNTRVRNNRVEGVYGTGIWGYYTTELQVAGNYVYNTADAGIDITANAPDAYGPDDYSENVVISENILKDVLVGIGCHGVYSGVVANNVITNTWTSAIIANLDTPGGHASPSEISITGNIIRKPFQFYGVGKYRASDVVSMVGGTHGIIEAWATKKTTIANNTIDDDSGLHAGYIGIFAGSKKLVISGNNLELDGQRGMVIGSYADATVPDQVDNVSVTGNTVVISRGNGWTMVYLNGVAKGNVSGNTFDCGGQGRVDPLGRFVLSNHSTDVNITGNTLSNVTGNVYSDVAASSNIILENNHGATGWNVGYYESATNLGDSMHVVNTRGKIVGKKVWDTTNLFFVYASGSNPTDAWHDGTGADVITPGP